MDVQAALEAIAADAERGEMVFSIDAEIIRRVQRALDDPDCPIDQLSKLISSEPMLSARVVGVANSVAYNPSGRGISDVQSAVSRLGFKALRTLVTAVIVRQMQEGVQSPEHRRLAARLWEHTAHVAALARVIARRVTRQDPEAAFFAGIVHEVGGFYLIARAAAFPGILDGNLESWHGDGEARVGRAVLHALGVPATILEALERLWDGYLAMPAVSLGDTLLLADQLSPVASPLSELAGISHKGVAADIDLLVDDEMLSSILAASAEEVESLTAALKS
ncbi:HDOD domain-containing protein [Dechloromonas sp. A34]|uniref:HDOD domain-containing protein n=1 Tax=Dechloromonas sp. A34 TaxID=447588 RepID=UPI0022497465|nr:HDOD domain-containing protein [Dechloromonas sp. A34]